MRLDLESEVIGRTGGITGSGARKVLGAPHLESLDVVIREAVQNSWDAARGERIEFGVLAYELDQTEKLMLTEAFAGSSRDADRIVALPDEGPVDALVLWDKGTSGLGGTVRADERTSGARDFVRFVYMIGDTKVQTDALAKGGTYGFGRSSFINASRVGTIFVHTVCDNEQDKVETRFIGMSWTEPHQQGKRNLTGRHWWGVRDRNDRLLPVTGRAATELARRLGMTPIDGSEYGTAIMILAPRWSASVEDEATAIGRSHALERIRSGLLWNCWPRLLDRSISVSMKWFGREAEMPDPMSDARLRTFARAYDAAGRLVSPRGTLKTTLRCLKPEKDLGTLAATQVPFVPSGAETGDEVDDTDEVRDTRKPLHHIALMRGTRLVIRYLETSTPPEGAQYGGVFIADPNIDAVYAASEPPAHDDWVRERLANPHEKTYVNVTFKRIQDAVRSWLHPVGDDPAGAADPSSLGLLADHLGTLFVDVEGPGGPGSPPKSGGGGVEGGSGGSRRGVRVEVLTPVRKATAERLELQVPINVKTTGSRSSRVTLTARALVIVDGGREKEPPTGAALPEVVGWQLGRQTPLIKKPTIDLTVEGQAECFVTIVQPRDCFIKIVVDAE